MTKTILITGATRGLGLETAKAVRERGARVLLAGRDEATVNAVAARIGGEPVVLDLARLDDVRAMARELPPLDAVACNAGLQLVGGQTRTPDGFEEAFQVNHLAHLALVDALLERPAPPARVVFVGSSTHDPAIRSGTPQPLDDDVPALADPAPDTESPRTAGLRRYATTKQLNVASAAGLAREHPELYFAALDPGLMPGTGLARQYPGPLRVLWGTALKGLRVLPFASSPAASARAFAALLCDDPPPTPSGAYVDFRLRVLKPSRRAGDPAYQDRMLRESRALLAVNPAGPAATSAPRTA